MSPHQSGSSFFVRGCANAGEESIAVELRSLVPKPVNCTGTVGRKKETSSAFLCRSLGMILFLSVDSLVNLECRLRRLDMILTVFQLFCKL